MSAQALVAELRTRGVELIPAGDRIRFRPASAVPPELVERLRAHKAEVLAILTPAPVAEVLSAEVHRRSLIFRHQVEQSAGGPLPILALPGVIARVGECLSCGAALPAERSHRCAACLTAVYVALDNPALASEVLCSRVMFLGAGSPMRY